MTQTCACIVVSDLVRESVPAAGAVLAPAIARADLRAAAEAEAEATATGAAIAAIAASEGGLGREARRGENAARGDGKRREAKEDPAKVAGAASRSRRSPWTTTEVVATTTRAAAAASTTGATVSTAHGERKILNLLDSHTF